MMKICTSFAQNMLYLETLERFRTTGYMWSLSEIYIIPNQVKFN
jgi:hypothetical protein